MKIKKVDRKGWFYSYNSIFETDMSIQAKMLYFYLCRCADSDSQSFPAKRLIIDHCSMGRTSIGNALRELEGARLIVRESRYRKNNSQTSNQYTIYPEPYGESVDTTES